MLGCIVILWAGEESESRVVSWRLLFLPVPLGMKYLFKRKMLREDYHLLGDFVPCWVYKGKVSFQPVRVNRDRRRWLRNRMFFHILYLFRSTCSNQCLQTHNHYSVWYGVRCPLSYWHVPILPLQFNRNARVITGMRWRITLWTWKWRYSYLFTFESWNLEAILLYQVLRQINKSCFVIKNVGKGNEKFHKINNAFGVLIWQSNKVVLYYYICFKAGEVYMWTITAYYYNIIIILMNDWNINFGPLIL